MSVRNDKCMFRNEDLVLKVTTDIDPALWDEVKYEPFIENLCGYREYQKKAIFTTLRFLIGGKYLNLRELAHENFNNNAELKLRYGSWLGMEKSLSFPDQLACSIDLATATGKSFVLYGIAMILLAEGAVDRVLILCPSNTIEDGLLSKFKELASNADLRDLLPNDAKIRTPKIINASESIIEGSICVENYHAILDNVKSSIRDSLKGKGAHIAVLNDEAHHVVNESDTKIKKWKEFLLNPEYNFRMIVGVSGTCYVGNNYFVDVIARYSLRQAIEENFVKKIEYISEIPNTSNPEEKWQLVYNRHQKIKEKYRTRNIRPLTIIITSDIKRCKQVAEELQDFLQEWEGISLDQAQDKVLPVSSAKEHQFSIARLKNVDTSASKVEWIVSVSMLSEGWDVKNVFQIVPHEERAFNSKLLIAQVLGRGLRRPENWVGEDLFVTVFNHDAWSGRIKHLVNEILEIERRLSSVVDPLSQFNFELHSIEYSREEDISEYTNKNEYKPFNDGYVELPTQVENEDVTIIFEQAITGTHVKYNARIKHKTWSIEEIADQIYNRLKSIDEESKVAINPADRTSYAKEYPLNKCTEIICESLKRANIHSERITDENRQRFLQALGTLKRKAAKRIIYKMSPNSLVILNTAERQSESCSAAELRRGLNTVFFTNKSEETLPEEQLDFFFEVKDPDGDFRAGSEIITNLADFKTPLNIVIADQTPERKFIRELCNRENARELDGWIKNTPFGFYSVEYVIKRRGYTKRGDFSPDFFIKQGNNIFVVEIKGDEEISEPSIENIKKYEYSVQHFSLLNDQLQKEGIFFNYYFHILSPKSYNVFFQKLRERKLIEFRSDLDVVIIDALKRDD